MSQAGSATVSAAFCIMCIYQFILHCILLCIPSSVLYTNTGNFLYCYSTCTYNSGTYFKCKIIPLTTHAIAALIYL